MPPACYLLASSFRERGMHSAHSKYTICGGEHLYKDPLEIAESTRGLGQFLQESSMVQPKKSDLDIYLEEPVEKAEVEKAEDDKFDILSWWKVHAGHYPVLSLMARNLLAILVSTVASECI